MATIVNGVPRHYDEGTEDQSRHIVYPEAPKSPIHRPIGFLKTKKGPLATVHENPNAMGTIFGDESFDPSRKYYNHQTAMVTTATGNGNAVSIKRIPPFFDTEGNGNEEDIKIANEAISIFAVQVSAPESVDDYERDVTGKAMKDANGEYVRDSNRQLTKVKVSAKTLRLDSEEAIKEFNQWGEVSPETLSALMDTQVSGDEKLFPLFALAGTGPGNAYNGMGYKISPKLGENTEASVLTEAGAMSYAFSWFDSTFGQDALEKTNKGDTEVTFAFDSRLSHPDTKIKLGLKDAVNSNYGNLTDTSMPLSFADFEVKVFREDNFKALATLLAASEKQAYIDTEAAGLVVDGWYDVDAAVDYDTKPAILNILTGKASTDIEYLGYEVDEEPSNAFDTFGPIGADAKLVEEVISDGGIMYLTGGTDGIEDDGRYEMGVVAALMEYADPDSPVQEIGLNPETVAYDTGFSLDTKKAFVNFIKIRTNTAIGLSTYVENEFDKPLTIAEEIANGSLLMNILKMAPESTIYGTPVMRGFIVAGSEDLVDGSYDKRISSVIEAVNMLSKRAGRGDGKLEPSGKYDNYPGSKLSLGKNIEPAFIPTSIRSKLFATGLIYPQSYDKNYFFAAMQTVYNNDTSVLNSVETMLIITSIHTANDWTWKRFTGNTTMKENAFKEAVEKYTTKALKGRYDNSVLINVECVITEKDAIRGYSWHLIVTIYANNMKTAMVSKVVSRRMTDLTN